MLSTLSRFIHKIDIQEAIRGLSIFIIFAGLAFGLSRYIGKEQIAGRIEQAGIRGPIIVIAWKAFSVVVIPFTGSITYALAGGLYGVMLGTVYTAVGNAIGMSISFYIGRIWGKKAVERFVGKKHIKEIIHLISHLKSGKKLALTRLILFPLEDFIHYAGGMSKITYAKFFLVSICVATLLSIAPIYFGYLLI